MGLETLPSSTTVASGLLIKSADFLTIISSLQGAFVGRNTSGVATSGQSLGTLLYPWGTACVNSLSIGGSVVDLSGIVSPANRIVSGKTRTTSGQPQFLQANGAAASVQVLGAATNLVLSIASTTATVDTDITISSLTTAPAANNTCAINDAGFTDQDESKYFGETDGQIPYITIDTVGSEISARVGQWITLKTDTSEYMFGFLESATRLTNVFRGFFFDDSLAPIVRETLIDDEVLTLMETGWIFVEDDGLTTDVAYTTPVSAYTSPGSPATGDYWFDQGNAVWKRYSGSAFVTVNRTLVGICVINTSNCVATRSFDFYKEFRDEDTLQCDVFSDTVIRSQYGTNSISVYGTDLLFENYPATWDNTADMETGSVGNDTDYYCYLSTSGQPKISTERPYNRTGDLRGKYHPYNNWRFVCKAKTDGAADWINVISSSDSAGVTKGLDFHAEDLLINATGNDEVTISYTKLALRNASGEEKTHYNGNHTVSFSGNLQGTEIASTWYSLWVDWDLNWKFVPDIEGTTDGTTTGYLVDSANEFATYGIFKSAVVYNTTDYVETYATASVASDNDDLAIADQTAGYFTSGDTYKIHSLDPVGLGEGACHIGYVENNGSSHLDNSGYTSPELQKPAEYSESAGDFTLTEPNLTTQWSHCICEQSLDFSSTPIWYIYINYRGNLSAPTSTLTIEMSGVLFPEIQAFTLFETTSNTVNNASTKPVNSNIFNTTFSGNTSDVLVNSKLRVSKKPTFATRS